MGTFDYKKFRDEVQEAAKDKGLTMEALARKVANIDRVTLSRQLNGKTRKLDVNLVADLCFYLSLNPGHYFCVK